ncbi:hypothetical protein BG58_35930 [Caballeronia jiangsuensis]|nr:hypothetical protein BG58_35930 [Caballeronia jiangsuensis]
MRMLGAAKLRALAAIHARAVCLNPLFVDDAWYGLGLSREKRHPESVNDVRAFEFDFHGLAHRNVNFVRGGDRRLARVVDLPPPVLRGDGDNKSRFAARRRDRFEREQHISERREERDGRNCRADPHPMHATAFGVNMSLIAFGARPPARNRANEQDHDDQRDDRHQRSKRPAEAHRGRRGGTGGMKKIIERRIGMRDGRTRGQ